MVETTLQLPDVEATERAGAALASALHGGMVVTLSGDLGAGKTSFARGVLRGLGWTGRVKSPTYALVEHYEFSSLYLYHFDFYRFEDSHDWESTGFAEYFRDDAACLVEWPERVAGVLPRVDVAVRLVPADGGRELVAVAGTSAGRQCLNAMAAACAGPVP